MATICCLAIPQLSVLYLIGAAENRPIDVRAFERSHAVTRWAG